MTAQKTKKKVALPTRDELRSFFEVKHCTLWGASFVLEKNGIDEAIDWVLTLFDDVNAWCAHRDLPEGDPAHGSREGYELGCRCNPCGQYA